MDTISIIALTGFGLLLWYFVNHSMKTWYQRNRRTGQEVYLNKIGHRGPWEGGDIEPDTITKLEKKLKNGEWKK